VIRRGFLFVFPSFLLPGPPAEARGNQPTFAKASVGAPSLRFASEG
jgi:hypothetical protein